jgi:hypothetical protein
MLRIINHGGPGGGCLSAFKLAWTCANGTPRPCAPPRRRPPSPLRPRCRTDSPRCLTQHPCVRPGRRTHSPRRWPSAPRTGMQRRPHTQRGGAHTPRWSQQRAAMRPGLRLPPAATGSPPPPALPPSRPASGCGPRPCATRHHRRCAPLHGRCRRTPGCTARPPPRLTCPHRRLPLRPRPRERPRAIRSVYVPWQHRRGQRPSPRAHGCCSRLTDEGSRCGTMQDDKTLKAWPILGVAPLASCRRRHVHYDRDGLVAIINATSAPVRLPCPEGAPVTQPHVH